MARHRQPHLAVLDPITALLITAVLIKASKTTAVRYERDRPSELVHVDVKKIGRIREGGGWKLHGRAHRERTRDRDTKIGYDYVHSLVDDTFCVNLRRRIE